MPDELEIEDTEEPVDPDETVEVGGDGPEGEPSGDDEPFLKVDDRTIYKSRDEALKGFNNTRQRLSEYREFGTPEELREMRERMQRLDEITGRSKGTSEDMNDPLAGLDDSQKAQWTAYWKRNEKALKQAGYIHENELPEYVDKRIDERERINAAHAEFRVLAQKAGLDVDEETMAALDNAAVALANSKSEFGRELNRLWFQPGGQAEFTRKVFSRLYGKLAERAPEPPKPAVTAEEQRQRDALGRYETAKRKTSQLPKNAKSGVAPAENAAEDHQKKLRDPKYRLAAAKRRMEELTGNAA